MRKNWPLVLLNVLLLLALFMVTLGALLDMKYLVEPASSIDTEIINLGYRHIAVYFSITVIAIILNVSLALWRNRPRNSV